MTKENTLTIKLTSEQQKQIKDATGKIITELDLKELEGVVGGADKTKDEETIRNGTSTLER